MQYLWRSTMQKHLGMKTWSLSRSAGLVVLRLCCCKQPGAESKVLQDVTTAPMNTEQLYAMNITLGCHFDYADMNSVQAGIH